MAINHLERISSGSYTPHNIDGQDTQKSQLYMLNAIQMIASEKSLFVGALCNHVDKRVYIYICQTLAP